VRSSAIIRIAGELDDRRCNGREPDVREESPDSESLGARKGVGEQGNAPGNARGLRAQAGEGSLERRGYGKCHRNLDRRCA
jgi:hypothetical protein